MSGSTNQGKFNPERMRVLRQSDITVCPHYIMVPEHYREDGSCKCDDPSAGEMKDWGYVWNEGAWR